MEVIVRLGTASYRQWLTSARQLALCAVLAASAIAPASAQLSVGFAMPGVRIGINVPFYPDLRPVPGYPVYYAPELDLNLFFYDGLYWSYTGDQWYSSAWYNGPWDLIGREFVPVFVLRIPVRYYRRPPGYFRGWDGDDAPRWGDRWGRDWAHRREGWDRWDHRSPPMAPLPSYQRDYRGDRYPRADEQRGLRDRHYDYRPQDSVARQHFDSPVRRPEHDGSGGSRSDRPPSARERTMPDNGSRHDGAGRPDRPPAGFDRPASAQPPERRAAPPQPETRPPARQGTERFRAESPDGGGRPPRAAQQAPVEPRRERAEPTPRQAPQQSPPRQRNESPRADDRRDGDRSPRDH